MKKINFDRLLNMPVERGAPHPKFNPKKINVSRICDELRPKDFTGVQGKIIIIDWIAQEWDADGVPGLIEEISRCLECNGYSGKVMLRAVARGCNFTDEGWYAIRMFDVG